MLCPDIKCFSRSFFAENFASGSQHSCLTPVGCGTDARKICIKCSLFVALCLLAVVTLGLNSRVHLTSGIKLWARGWTYNHACTHPAACLVDVVASQPCKVDAVTRLAGWSRILPHPLLIPPVRETQNTPFFSGHL